MGGVRVCSWEAGLQLGWLSAAGRSGLCSMADGVHGLRGGVGHSRLEP